MLDSDNITREGIQRLKNEVETYVDRRIVTPADFDYLARAIVSSVHQSVSATTLKRMWGYMKDAGDDYLPGRYTLCTVARFVGYKDFESFLESTPSGAVQSRGYFGETVNSADIPDGVVVRLEWEPDRLCELRHIEGDRFEVVNSVNAKLLAGDEAYCTLFTQLAPAYFYRIRRKDHDPMSYLAGSRTGVRYEIVHD